MAQVLATSFIRTSIPGAYFDVTVKNSPSGLGNIGTVAIIGEANSGTKFSSETDLKNNYFSADQISSVLSKYGSGPIVDAFRALAVPSGDTNITGAPSRIHIFQTNAPVAANSSIPSYGTLQASKAGTSGNAFFYTISQSQAEDAPSLTGSALSFVTPSDFTGKKFAVRVQGGAETLIDVLTGATTEYDSISEMVALIDAALPAGITCTASGTSLKLEMDADANANIKGFKKSFELVEKTAGHLAALGLTAGMVDSSAEPMVEINIQNLSTNANETLEVGGNVCFEIGYQGTTAAMVINGTTLSTTVTGGTGTNLSITLANYATIGALVDFINNQAGYIAYVEPTFKNLSPSVIDQVSTDICSTVAGIYPAAIKKDLYDWKVKLDSSLYVDFTATAVKGLPLVQAKTYLSGGLKGSTANVDITNALISLEGIEASFVVPLFSRDASADIAESLTEAASTYTIDAINSLVKSHVLKMSTAKIKKHRIACVSKWATFSEVRSAVGSLSHARVNVCMQKVRMIDSNGNSTAFLPWMASCISSGMQSAGFYKGITHKYANIIDFIDPSGFDSGSNGDMESALESGIMFLEKTTNGSRWVSDQTSYGLDSNFVYNSMQAIFLSDILSLDLAFSMDNAFVGQSLADVDAAAGLSFLASKMAQYKSLKIIAASDDAPAGFKNASVRISGPTMYVNVEVKLATSLYFIPMEIAISQITSTAE